MNNTLVDLNNYLFEALEGIQMAETGGELDLAIKRAKAVRDVGTVIVNNANVMVKAMKFRDEKMGSETVPTERLLTGAER
ncbi:MAG: hypothetical protein IJJ14_05065 [Coriobacteriales bacterium]|nr:hypothetical protein [Coriobacteriales bacterium]